MEVELRLVADGLRFPEGPVAMTDGSIVLVEVARGTLSRVSPSGEVSILAELGGGPNGAAVGPDGAIYICNNGGRYTYAEQDGLTLPTGLPAGHRHGSIQRVDLTADRIETLYTACSERPLLAPNDLVFDADGGLWFTDHGVEDLEGSRHGALYYARVDRPEIRHAAIMRSANGVGLSPGGGVVYVSDTMSGRLWAFDVTGRGQVAAQPSPVRPGRLVQTLQGFQLLDSLAVEASGDVCVATIGNGGVTIFSPDGSTTHIPVPDRITTNLCFGGSDMRDVWITASSTGRLYHARWPRPGLRLAFNA